MWLQPNSAPLSAPGPASQPLPHLWGGLAEAVLRCLLEPGDPDAAVGCSQLDRPGEQHRVSGTIEGLRPDAQGGDGQEMEGERAPSRTYSRGRWTHVDICHRL